mgnify:CR=1 FL=1
MKKTGIICNHQIFDVVTKFAKKKLPGGGEHLHIFVTDSWS